MRHAPKRVKRQLELVLRTWGGRRKGAGRKPEGARATAPHHPRPVLTGRVPVHVTMRVRPHVWNLRSKRCFSVIKRALVGVQGRSEHFRVSEFSVQGNHIHLITEAQSAEALARGMQALAVRIAKGLNKLMGRRGPVFLERYRERLLCTAREVRNALSYVLNNDRRHARQHGRPLDPAPFEVDWYSSGRWFSGWAAAVRIAASEGGPPLVRSPRSWLLRVGWRSHGPIARKEVPGPRRESRPTTTAATRPESRLRIAS